MALYKIILSDEVTYRRTYAVERDFATEEEAWAWGEANRDAPDAFTDLPRKKLTTRHGISA